MKKFLIFSIVALTFSSTLYGSVTERKVISHRFPNEGAASKLSVDSQYGNVNVTQANQDYIDVRVEIKATARKKEDAQRVLNNIEISFSGRGTSCQAATRLKSDRRGNTNFEIEYTVTLPKGASLDVVNKYGNISAGSLDGRFTADVKYGNINAGELNGSGNKIDIKYGNVSLDNTPQLQLVMGYGNFKAINIADLACNTKYSNINIGYVGNCRISGSAYDNYNIDKVHTLKSSSGTSGITIGTLIKSINLPSVKYGNVTIKKVEPGFENININSAYAAVRIDFENPSFQYELYAKYGNVRLDDLQHQNKTELRGYTDVKLEGITGGGTDRKIKVTSSYGDVILGTYK
ncbi:MAG: hypothetical protein LIO77_04800 [Rikenellaceae bacterium]|nr:hypothetical protein [Rikenellaceae bacterium]